MMKKLLNRNHKAGLATTAALILIYAAALCLPSGPITRLLASIPAMVIGITALARVNDLSHNHTSTRWQVRRMGLIFAGVASVIYLLGGIAISAKPVEWREVLFLYGIALTWLTTPDQPPWWQYITGEKHVFSRRKDD